jgi:hypothetical protein
LGIAPPTGKTTAMEDCKSSRPSGARG